MRFLVERRRRLGLLVGPPGSGKSLLLEVFAQSLQKKGSGVFYRIARLGLLGVEPAEMLWRLAAQWGLNPAATASTSTLWRMLEDRLREFRYQRLPVVTLMDDADAAQRATLDQIARLCRYDPSPEMQLTVVLAGRNDGMARLGEPLAELADLRIELEPWQREDVERFINERLAGERSSEAFAPPAIQRLHELTHGIPRRVCRLADMALLAGVGTGMAQIDAETVESVWQEAGIRD